MQQKKVFITGLVIMVLITLGVFVLRAQAATLTVARDYLNHDTENLSTGVTHEIIFTPGSNGVSGGAGLNKIILVFPLADNAKWCRIVGGDGVVTTTTLHDAANALPGTSKTVTCTQGNGTTTYDTITISGVDNLTTAGGPYGFRIADGSTEKFGTPANTSTGIVTIKTNNGTIDVDTRNIVVDIITNDTIAISGKVDATMTMAISNTTIGFGSITAAAVRYATADQLGAASAPANGAPVTVSVSTNAQAGLVVEIRDSNANAGASGLYSANAAKTLASTDAYAVTLGNEQFGVYGKNVTGTGFSLDTKFDNDASGGGAISNVFQTIASSSVPLAAGSFDISAKAAISGNTPAGDYADTVIVVATGKF
jgi:hypothetical protein